MGDVVKFTGLTTNKIPPNQVLEMARDELEAVVIIGYTHDGNLYIASSDDLPETILHMEVAKIELLK